MYILLKMIKINQNLIKKEDFNDDKIKKEIHYAILFYYYNLKVKHPVGIQNLQLHY